jgi:RimJ/RimL family protein N-acetyltransferase
VSTLVEREEAWLRLVRVRGDVSAEVPWDLEDPFVRRYVVEMAASPWRNAWDRRRRQVFALALGERLVGEAELFDIRRGEGVAELRICLGAPGSRGRGLGRRAVLELLAYAKEHLALAEVYLRVQEDNLRAIRCYERCGFRKVGRLQARRGRSGSILLMSRPLRERGDRP